MSLRAYSSAATLVNPTSRAWRRCRPAARATRPGRGRGGVDDRAARTLLEHLQDLVLHAQPHALEVDGDDTVEVLLGIVGGAERLAMMPALLCAQSRRPKILTAAATVASTSAARVTSHL